MDILMDMHTHTLVSGHAFSTLQENISAAQRIGLSFLGVTEHGPAMPNGTPLIYFQNYRAVPRQFDDLILYLGAEVNIVDYQGGLDIPEESLKTMDFAIASMHPICIPFGTKKENTRALIGAMENPLIHILGHPGDPRCPIDVDEIVCAALETHTLIEMNNASLDPNGFRVGSEVIMKEILLSCMKYDCPIIVNSDAHFSSAIGNFGRVRALLDKIEFPSELIVNFSKEKFLAYV